MKEIHYDHMEVAALEKDRKGACKAQISFESVEPELPNTLLFEPDSCGSIIVVLKKGFYF